MDTPEPDSKRRRTRSQTKKANDEWASLISTTPSSTIAPIDTSFISPMAPASTFPSVPTFQVPDTPASTFQVPDTPMSALGGIAETPRSVVSSSFETPRNTSFDTGRTDDAITRAMRPDDPDHPDDTVVKVQIQKSSDRSTFFEEKKVDEAYEIGPPIPINYRRLITTAYSFYEEETLVTLEARRPKSHLNNMLDQCKQKKSAQGDKRMLLLKELLDYVPKSYQDWTRSKMQVMFHKNFLQAVCLHLYRDDVDVDMSRIMRMNGFDNLKQQVLCLTPRRFGKSTSVAMFVASYALSVPKSEQCIFSTGRRASQKLLELIRDMIIAGKYRDMFLKCNAETMLVKGDSELDIRKVHSYPSCAKTLRGCGGDVVYMEEAAFMSLDVFFEVIVPLLEMETTALIAISTPLDGLNFYSEMFDLKGGDGKPLFNTLRVGLSCEKCQKAGKAAECTHMASIIPPWKSAAKFDMVKSIYGDRKDLLARESMGQITNDAASVFSQKLVDRMFSKVPWCLKNKAKFIFLGVDPNGGGSSELAIVTLTMEQNNIIICGAESHPARNHDMIQMLLVQHIRALRGHPDLRDAWIINFFESNLGQESSHMAHMVKDERRCWTMYEKGKAGVVTTHERKTKYTESVLNFFNMEAIHFINEPICANPYVDANDRWNKVKAEFKKQLLQFQKNVLMPANAWEVAKVVYSGKVKAGMNDDIAMTLLFTCFWAQQFVGRKIQAPYDSFEA